MSACSLRCEKLVVMRTSVQVNAQQNILLTMNAMSQQQVQQPISSNQSMNVPTRLQRAGKHRKASESQARLGLRPRHVPQLRRPDLR